MPTSFWIGAFLLLIALCLINAPISNTLYTEANPQLVITLSANYVQNCCFMLSVTTAFYTDVARITSCCHCHCIFMKPFTISWSHLKRSKKAIKQRMALSRVIRVGERDGTERPERNRTFISIPAMTVTTFEYILCVNSGIYEVTAWPLLRVSPWPVCLYKASKISRKLFLNFESPWDAGICQKTGRILFR